MQNADSRGVCIRKVWQICLHFPVLGAPCPAACPSPAAGGMAPQDISKCTPHFDQASVKAQLHGVVRVARDQEAIVQEEEIVGQAAIADEHVLAGAQLPATVQRAGQGRAGTRRAAGYRVWLQNQAGSLQKINPLGLQEARSAKLCTHCG